MSQPAWTHGVRIAGTGSCLPSRTLTNADFEKLVDTTDEWIFQRTGIRERHIAAKGETTSMLGEKAARAALANAGLTPDDIDLIIVGTHGRGAVAHFLMGSVAERIVRTAPCPVLTVRQPGADFVVPDALSTVTKA